MASETYNYQDDVFASPQELEGMVGAAKEYLYARGTLSWGRENNGEAGETDLDEIGDGPTFYTFEPTEDGIANALPIVGWDAAPTYTRTANRSEILNVAPTTMASLAVNGLTCVVFSYQEASVFVDPEPGDDPVTGWGLEIAIYGKVEGAAEEDEDPVSVINVYEDEDGDVDADVLRIGQGEHTDLMFRECYDLYLLANALKTSTNRHLRRKRR